MAFCGIGSFQHEPIEKKVKIENDAADNNDRTPYPFPAGANAVDKSPDDHQGDEDNSRQLPRIFLERTHGVPPCPKGQQDPQNTDYPSGPAFPLSCFADVARHWVHHRFFLLSPKLGRFGFYHICSEASIER